MVSAFPDGEATFLFCWFACLQAVEFAYPFTRAHWLCAGRIKIHVYPRLASRVIVR